MRHQQLQQWRIYHTDKQRIFFPSHTQRINTPSECSQSYSIATTLKSHNDNKSIEPEIAKKIHILPPSESNKDEFSNEMKADDDREIEVEIIPPGQQDGKQPIMMTRRAAIKRTKALPLEGLLAALDRRGIRYSVSRYT